MTGQPIWIRGGRLIDPATGRDEPGDLFVAEGRIAPRPASIPADTRVVEAAGRVVTAGFIDLHVHLREPGGETAETIEPGSRAAARGGFTTVVAMPNTQPPLDTPERVAWVARRSREAGFVRVIPCGCVTRGRQGRELADLAGLAAAGAGAFSDDGCAVQPDALMRRALEITRDRDLPVIMDHAQDRAIEKQGGVLHDGARARALGLPGLPARAEAITIQRDIELAVTVGRRVHIQHVTSREGVDLIRDGRRRGIPVTGELTPHHLALADEDIPGDDANFKMNPPLRSAADRAALRAAILDGTLDAFATDHAPHPAAEKARGFRQAPFGVVGLETAVGITYTELVAAGAMDLLTWIRRWTLGPARVLGMPAPSLAEGAAADLVILNLDETWTVDPLSFVSRCRNTPFTGRRLRGRAEATVCGGRLTWRM
jgi:dihydroorotase